MKTEASLLQAIAGAATLREQIALTQELDALRAAKRQSVQAARDLDLANAVVEQTFAPVRVHEHHTASTDWLDDVATQPIDKTAATQSVLAEAALWFGRVAAEVKADAGEFAEQARGQARRTAGAYGESAPEMERAYLDYVAFLRRREAASGLDQIQQTYDAHDNPKTTEMPEDVFDTFEAPVAPENVGVDEMQSSYNAPLMQEIMSNNGGPGTPDVPNGHGAGGYQGPRTNGSGFPVGAALQAEAGLDDDPVGGPSVAINHAYTLDQFIKAEAVRKQAGSPGCPTCAGPMKSRDMAGGGSGWHCADGNCSGNRQVIPAGHPLLQARPRHGDGIDLAGSREPRPFAEGAAAPAPGVATAARFGDKCPNSGRPLHEASWAHREEAGKRVACAGCGGAVATVKRNGKAYFPEHNNTSTMSMDDFAPRQSSREVVARFERVADGGRTTREMQERGEDGKCGPCVNGNHSGTNGTPGCRGRGCTCSNPNCGKIRNEKRSAQVEAASGLDQVQQLVDSQERPKPTGLPEEVAFPLNEEDMQTTDGSDPRKPRPSAHNSGTQAAKTAGHEVEIDAPRKCDVCKMRGKDTQAAYDSRIPGLHPSSWANVCEDHFQQYGPGQTGTGHAQRLKVKSRKTADMYGGGDSPHGVPGVPVANNPGTTAPRPNGSYADGQAAGARDAVDPNAAPTYSDKSAATDPYVQGYVDGYQNTPVPTARQDVPPSMQQDRTKGSTDGLGMAAALQRHAGLVSKETLESRDFRKGYRYASRWTPRQRIVRQGSVEFESGLYAGMLDNTVANQRAWTRQHEKWGRKDPIFIKRMALHRQFTDLRAQAGTSTDLETMEPGLGLQPGGNTPINGPGEEPPLAGGMDPAAPGGAAPYNGAAPYSTPVAPDPEWLDPRKMSPQTLAFRQAVQASLLASKEQ